MTAAHREKVWQLGNGRYLALDRPRIMGILNVTPDSFSDGGQHTSLDAAVEAGIRMATEGADIIDVGGESTRPGSARVDAATQISRTQEVIRALSHQLAIPISIDTTLADVAATAIDAGATIVNDISAGLDDPQMLRLAADRQCGIVLMHRRTVPQRDVYSHAHDSEPEYMPDVVEAVRRFLAERIAAAVELGTAATLLAIDPGLGFGKSVRQNFELIRRLNEFSDLRVPILIGASRKSFIGQVTGQADPANRVVGSVTAAIEAVRRGAAIIRVHDVAAHREALAMTAAIADI